MTKRGNDEKGKCDCPAVPVLRRLSASLALGRLLPCSA